MRRQLTVVTVLVIMGIVAFVMQTRDEQTSEVAASLSTVVTADIDYSAFQQANESDRIVFPDDFGLHLDYLIEWWYYTGNLQTVDGREFGYQLTFFRRALSNPLADNRVSEFATSDVYMAHFSITDVENSDFYTFERFQRGGELASAVATPYQVWLDNWSVKEVGERIYKLRAEAGSEISINLTLTDLKQPVLQGDQGLSVKNSETGYASHYFSQTRLESYGTLTINNKRFSVTGLSWMDREWSTPTDGDISGWDWFALHLSDGRDLMFYQLRKPDGSIEDATSGALVEVDGSNKALSKDDVQLEVLAHWNNRDGDSYPAQWRLAIPSQNLDLIVTPLVRDQEIRGSQTYWEGAVNVVDTLTGLSGSGYVELTGYADDLSYMR